MPDEDETTDAVEHAMNTESRLTGYSTAELFAELCFRHEAVVLLTMQTFENRARLQTKWEGNPWTCWGMAEQFLQDTQQERRK